MAIELINTAKIWIEDGIVQVVFEPNSNVSLDSAKEIIAHRLKITEFQNYPLYVDIRGILFVDEKTRKHLSSHEGTKCAIGAAIHVDNPISKFFGNLFITVNKPDKPTKLFTNKDRAIQWLKKIK